MKIYQIKITLFLITITIFNGFAQTDQFYLNANKLKLILTEAATIKTGHGVVGEWPIWSGHEYLDTVIPFVISGDPNPEILQWSLESGPFMSDKPTDWPSAWNEEWQGYKGAGIQNADLEYLAVFTNTDKNLQLSIRIWQWNHYLAQDFVVFFYELTNNNSTTQNELAFGLFANPDVGGESSADFISAGINEVFAEDEDNRGEGRGIAKGIGTWRNVGQLSFYFLEVPELTQAGQRLNSFTALNSGNFDANNASDIWGDISAGHKDQRGQSNSFASAAVPFSIPAGDTKRMSFAIVVSNNQRDRTINNSVLEQIISQDYDFTLAPPAPGVTLVAKNRAVTIYWDKKSESWPGFEGYKILKSSDPGFNDVYTVTDDHGNLIYHDVEETYDIVDNVRDFFPLHFNGFRYDLGKQSGLKYTWTDLNVNNGKTYYYAVVAYTRGDAENGIYPSESLKRFLVLPNGDVLRQDNTIQAMPLSESLGFIDEAITLNHETGFSTGNIDVSVVDRSLVREGAQYQITFDDTSLGFTTYTVTDITEPQSTRIVIEDSDNFSLPDNLDESVPLFDGMRIFLFDKVLKWNSSPEQTTWLDDVSNWKIELVVNSNLGEPIPVAADYEVRFGEMGIDTALFTTPIPIPFEVWNVTDPQNNYKENVLIIDQNADGEWNSAELIYIVEGTTVADFRPVYWTIILTEPVDSITSIPPASGAIARIRTQKPFASTDSYILETTAFTTGTNLQSSDLSQIAVVPNPYVINSRFEQRSMFTGGNLERNLQFINLPLECDIRIFDIRGSLLRTLNHRSTSENGVEFWDLKTEQGNVVSYGIYIYHITAPGIGETIGRFGIVR
jgi:hypothetical protein